MKIPQVMEAAVYRGKNDLRIESVPVPRIFPGELLIRVAVCGVCPTDIKKIHFGTLPPPRIFGHETAGTVVRVGALVRGFKIGDRVALHHHIPCLRCRACQHRAFAQCATYKKTGVTAGFEAAGGGFAEYVRVMPFVLPGVVKIPRRNSFIEGAMLEPVNTVLKAVNKLRLMHGDVVLVIGQGPIGLLFTRLFKLQGTRVWATEIIRERLDFARHWGAERALNPSNNGFMENCLGAVRGGFDAVVVTVPSDTAVNQGEVLVRRGGQILLFAHTQRGEQNLFDFSSVCVEEKDLIGSYSADVTLQKKVSRRVFSGEVDVTCLVSHRFPLRLTEQAVKYASKPTASALKVVVEPGRELLETLDFTGRMGSGKKEEKTGKKI